MTPRMLFGAPTLLDSAKQQWWIHLLTKNWLALMGRPPHLLEADLDAMASIFANGTSPKNVKTRIYDLPAADAETQQLPREVMLIIDGCALITPEGRILLGVLLDLQFSGEVEIDVDRHLSALSTATALRSEWYERWLHSQFEFSASAPVLGAGLFLLINGSVGESRALLLPTDSDGDRALGAIVMPLIAGFSKSLGGSAPVTDAGIRQHWAFTQLSRLFGRDVARKKVKTGTATFVRIGRERNLLDELALRLERIEDANLRYAAITAFVDGYRRTRGPLAALGLMHEDPTTTRRITDRLLSPGGTL